MDIESFRLKLKERGFDNDQIRSAIETVVGFESHLQETASRPNDKSSLISFCKKLVDSKNNSWHNIYSLALYGKTTGNEVLTVNALELLDGTEALGNLKNKLFSELGESETNKLFDGVKIPEIGEPNTIRPPAMKTIIERMESTLGADKTIGMISGCLRDLDDSWYQADLKLFEECGRDVDKFIKTKGDRYIVELETLKNEGGLYFTQPITDAVIEFVKANPEIQYGVRISNALYDTKIPHQTAKMLAETDPIKRRYHYCHCPWVKESLINGRSDVSPIFCNCSAGFHKRMWEVLFNKSVKAEVLETVLKGDNKCRFKIYLP